MITRSFSTPKGLLHTIRVSLAAYRELGERGETHESMYSGRVISGMGRMLASSLV